MLNITNQSILEQISSSIAWKDTKLKYLGANKNLLAMMKLRCQNELIGLDDNELFLDSPELNTFFREQDLLVLQGHSLEIIHNLENQDDQKMYFLQKTPLRDNQNTIIGVILNCTVWSQANLLTILNKMDQKNCAAEDVPNYYHFDTYHNPVKLSERELECLFLLLRGHTAKQIAEILNLSKRTIEYYIDNIKTKFGCLNKAELLVTAMAQGYQRHVPKSLLKLPGLLSP